METLQVPPAVKKWAFTHLKKFFKNSTLLPNNVKWEIHARGKYTGKHILRLARDKAGFYYATIYAIKNEKIIFDRYCELNLTTTF